MMIRKPVFVVLFVIALVTMACGITIPVQVKTGETVTQTIQVPLVAGNTQTYVLTLSFGAGNFKIGPGAEDAVVSGTATYNVADFKTKVTANQNVIHVEQGNLKLGGVPNFKKSVRNDWVLQLTDEPMRLTVNAGAYSGKYELGGLALESLDITDGAADVDLVFSNPNQVDMDTLHYTTGASSVKLIGLANARFTEMKFRSGAGDYTLDFTGDLRRNASVTVEAGLSNVHIVVPVGVPARVTFEGGLSEVNLAGDWQQDGDVYSQPGSGPQLTILVKMGAGSLSLKNP